MLNSVGTSLLFLFFLSMYFCLRILFGVIAPLPSAFGFSKKKLPILARCFLFSSCLCAAFRLYSGRLGQFFIHCFQQVLQKFSVVKVVQNEHFFGALIRNGGFRAFEKCLCGSRLLKQKTVDRRFRRPPCL